MLETEMRNPKTKNISKASTLEMLRLINAENEYSVKKVGEALDDIARAVDMITEAIRGGGRLIYVGCGTSGRLALVDASECPPTYGVDPSVVSAVMAGGLNAVVTPAEKTEDNEERGRADILLKNPSEKDVVMGISAAGGAKYVYGAMEEAKKAGAKLVSLSSNTPSLIGSVADVEICVHTGAEAITGSTRMKAGNAQKMVLNMITTSVMIKLGKVYENLMVNIRPVNEKLVKRMIYITSEILGCDENTAKTALEQNGYDLNAIIAIKERNND